MLVKEIRNVIAHLLTKAEHRTILHLLCGITAISQNNKKIRDKANSDIIYPSKKESSIEIKQNTNKALDTERENMIKKLESFKAVKTLFIMRNDLDFLPLPDQPLKQYSSNIDLENTNNEIESFLKATIDQSERDSKRGSNDSVSAYLFD